MREYRIGLDIGSTTAKAVVIDSEGRVVFSDYRRHRADIAGCVQEIFSQIALSLPQGKARMAVTGSVGMGLAERQGIPFVQEVSATVRAVRGRYPGVTTVIDIG